MTDDDTAPEIEDNDADILFEKLVKLHERAARVLLRHMRERGWHWSTNFLREYVRASSGIKFTNTWSPDIYREVVRRWPDLAVYIDLGKLKEKD